MVIIFVSLYLGSLVFLCAVIATIYYKTGALIIGYLTLTLSGIGLLVSVLKFHGGGIVSSILSVIIGGCIIYANQARKPGGYLPYLILTAIGIVIYTIFIVFFVIMTVAIPGAISFSNYIQNGGNGTQHKQFQISNYTQNYGYGTQHKQFEKISNYAQNYGYETQYKQFQIPSYLQDYVDGAQHQAKYVDPKTAIPVVFLIWAAVMLFIDWIAIWLWMVVYRAYQQKKSVEEYDRGQTYRVKLNDV